MALKVSGIKIQMEKTRKALKPSATIYEGCREIVKLIALFYLYIQFHKEHMDKQIRKIEKKVQGTEKSLKSLEKADKKRDKECDYGKRMMKKKKGKK